MQTDPSTDDQLVLAAVLTKRCLDCGETKPWSEFYIQARSGRPRSRCKPCLLAYNRERRNPENHAPRESGWARKRQADPTWERRETLRRKYNITPEKYAELYTLQGGLCAICLEPETITVRSRNPWTLAVDHDHATGRVRGLLCNRCNLLLGKVHDESKILRAAIKYLKER